MQRLLMAGLAGAAIMAAGTAVAEDAKSVADYDGCGGLPVVVTEPAPDAGPAAREAAARERIGSMIDGALARTASSDTPPMLASSPLPRRDVKPGS